MIVCMGSGVKILKQSGEWEENLKALTPKFPHHCTLTRLASPGIWLPCWCWCSAGTLWMRGDGWCTEIGNGGRTECRCGSMRWNGAKLGETKGPRSLRLGSRQWIIHGGSYRGLRVSAQRLRTLQRAAGGKMPSWRGLPDRLRSMR